MNKTTKALLAFLVLGTLGCAKSPSDSADQGTGPATIDQQLAGAWKLENDAIEKHGHRKAPRIVSFEINQNGLREANYCDLDSVESGGSDYEVRDGSLYVTYYTFHDNLHSRHNDMPTQESHFSGKITRLDGDTLEIDGRYRYHRISFPTASEHHLKNVADMCQDN
jgi:hypothetical protein